MSVGKARGELWTIHLDPAVTPEKLERAAVRFAVAKQRASDRRDQWKLRRAMKNRAARVAFAEPPERSVK